MNKGKVEQTGTAQEVYEHRPPPSPISSSAPSISFPATVDGQLHPRRSACRLRQAGEDMVQGRGCRRLRPPPRARNRLPTADARRACREGQPRACQRARSVACRAHRLNGSAIRHAEPQHPRGRADTRSELADLGLQPGQPVRLTSSRLQCVSALSGNEAGARCSRPRRQARSLSTAYAAHPARWQCRRAQLDEAVCIVAQIAAVAHGDACDVFVAEQMRACRSAGVSDRASDRTPWRR